MCQVQEKQLFLSLLCSYLPWSWNLVQAITPILFEIIWWYLVGMKQRNSKLLLTRQTTLFSPLKQKSYAAHNSQTVWDNLIIYIVGTYIGTYIRSSRSVACKKDNFCYVRFLVISPEQISKPSSCALHHFLMVWNILIIFDRGIDEDQKGCHMQEKQLSLSSL